MATKECSRPTLIIIFFSVHDEESVMPKHLGPFCGEMYSRHKSGNQAKDSCCCGLTFNTVRSGENIFFKALVHTDLINLWYQVLQILALYLYLSNMKFHFPLRLSAIQQPKISWAFLVRSPNMPRHAWSVAVARNGLQLGHNAHCSRALSIFQLLPPWCPEMAWTSLRKELCFIQLYIPSGYHHIWHEWMNEWMGSFTRFYKRITLLINFSNYSHKDYDLKSYAKPR